MSSQALKGLKISLDFVCNKIFTSGNRRKISLMSLPSSLLLVNLPSATGGITMAVTTKMTTRNREKYILMARITSGLLSYPVVSMSRLIKSDDEDAIVFATSNDNSLKDEIIVQLIELGNEM